MHMYIKFLEDFDDSYNIYEENGIELQILPHIGECLYINGFYHRVIDVVHSEFLAGEKEQSICLHLGKSAQSPEEARSEGYGISAYFVD